MQECFIKEGEYMNIKCVENEEKYIRTIEEMGEGLVLFKTCIVNRRFGQNFHLFFSDKRKPPLDIAINPERKTIEYFSYFAQDEKIVERGVKNEVKYKSGIVTIEEDLFGEENTNIELERSFEIVKNKSNIFILSSELTNEPLQAYQIDSTNYLLFSNSNEFCGILLKEISKKELEEIKNSKCL